jgi:TonB-linked SusC/RagA family outer membrane protein
MKKNSLFLFVLILIILGNVSAQQRTITGIVTSASDGLALPGVTVVVKEVRNIGTVTDVNGAYSIKVPETTTALVFSFIGMETKSVVIGNSSVIDVVLEMSTESLEEVMVTALGIQKEVKALGFAAQEIGERDLSASRASELSSYMTGKIAGVQVSKTASGVGGSTVVTIRGNSSISGNNQPLYVVDGVPIINESNSSPSGGLFNDHDYGDGVFDLNPEDVESMTVLKGPNASALYGSRGANGVILITTKSGKKKKGIGVEINSRIAVDEISLLPKFQNKFGSGYDDDGVSNYGKVQAADGQYYYYPEWGNIDSWGGPLDGSMSIIDVYHFDGEPDGVMPYVAQPASNVKDLFYKTGFSNINNVAITGSNDKSSVRFSLGNSSMEGVIPNHKIEKINLSIRATSQINEKLSIDGKISYDRTEGDQRPVTGYQDNNPVWNLAIMARFTPLDFIKEYYEKTKSYARFPGENYNPWYIVNELKNNDCRDRFIGFMSGTLKFNDWLSLTGRVGADTYTEMRENTWPVGARGSDNSRGRIEQSTRHFRDIDANALLTAQKQVSNDFSLSASFGASYLSQRRETMSWDARNFKVADVFHVTNANDVRADYNLWRKEIQSVFFTGQVAYKNYLFFDVTGRNDWSSSLGINNYSFFYPSVSTSFVFTDAFNVDQNLLSFGKIRASWAQVGNDSAPYLTTQGYNLYNITINGQTMASKSGRIPLYNLKNELTESWEIGTDLRFLKDRVSLDLTYYNGKTTNQILSSQISVASGYSDVVINAGEIQNKGVEGVLRLTPIKRNNGFRWDINFNYAANRSKVVELAPGIESYILIDTDLNDVEARVGEAFGNIIGYKYRRAPDGQKIVSENGGYVRESKQSILGNINPKWIGGLNNTFSYKGLSLNVLLDFVQGGQLTSFTRYMMTMKGTGAWTVEGRRPKATDENGNQLPYVGVLDGVVEVMDAQGNVTGYEKNTKAVAGHTYWANRAWSGIGEEFVMDASYISLREVMLSYEFPKSLFSKTPFTSLTLTLIGRNLMYLEEHMKGTGVSPESQPNTAVGAAGIEALALPPTRTYGLNVKLTF